MKVRFYKRYESGKIKRCLGNEHFLELSNGEKIKVATDKEIDIGYGQWWNVTDIETGVAIIGWHEHTMFIYPFEHNNQTEKEALLLAKERLDMAIKTFNKTYKELTKKFKKITQQEIKGLEGKDERICN